MLGAVIGDTVGSIYEFDNIKNTTFEPFFHPESNYTDDSILSIAIADWLLNTDRSQQMLEQALLKWGNRFPYPMGGYGTGFERWLFHPEILHEYRDINHLDDANYGTRHPYNSWSNGAAMRASACGWVGRTIEETLDLAKRSAQITHNHPEGIMGAQATAACIFMARKGASKDEIATYIEQQFRYNLHRTCDEIRPIYGWDGTCRGTVPEAIVAFLDSTDFESAIRLAVSLGGDSDTLACITGGIAESFYGGVPEWMRKHMYEILPPEFIPFIEKIQRYGYRI